MRHERLKVARCDETGEVGFILDKVPRIDGMMMVAASGELIAHDLMEHQNGLREIGTIIDEMQAFGGMWFVRGWSGQLRNDNWGAQRSCEWMMSGDMVRMFGEMLAGAYMPPIIPVTHECDIEDEITEIIELSHYRDEHAASDHDMSEGQYETAVERYNRAIRAHMRIGYRKATKRYESRDRAHRQFWSVAHEVDRLKPRIESIEGFEYVLSYGNGACSIREAFDIYD